MFHDTIRHNLLWGKPDASDDDIWAALKLAAADTFVKNLPEGLDTVVKDRGVRLSGGERQRIALARTLIRHPTLLILDEATSALDLENEQKIFEAISALKHQLTIIFISHKQSLAQFADHVIKLDAVTQ